MSDRSLGTEQFRFNTQITLALIQGCVFGLLAVLGLTNDALNLFNLTDSSLIYPASLLALILTGWSLWSWRLAGQKMFDPYTVFLICAWLFNGGQLYLEVFHLNPQGVLGGQFSTENLLKTIYLVILSMSILHFGALISTVGSKKPPTSVTADDFLTRLAVRRVGWILLGISAGPALLTMRESVGVVLSSGYLGLYQQPVTDITGVNASGQILADFLVPAALLLLAGAKGSRRTILVSLGVILVYALIQLFLGSRNRATLPLLAYAWVWTSCIKALPKWVFLVAALLAVLIFPIVAASRDSSGSERLSGNFLSYKASSIDNPLVASIGEMGDTMKTITYTLELIPLLRDYDHGESYYYASLTIFPNFFWKIHPTIAHGTPSYWITWEVDSWLASRGGGLGYSLIGEAYFNFGWFGTPLVVGLIGFLFSRLVVWATSSKDAARMAFLACCMAYFPFLARQDAANIVRQIIWYSLFPYVIIVGLKYYQNPKLPKIDFFLRPGSNQSKPKVEKIM